MKVTKSITDFIYVRNEEEFLCTEVDGETVIMNTNSGSYYGFNSIATDIWKHLKDPITFEAMIDLLLKEYDVKRDVCVSDTEPLIKKMVQLNIVKAEG